MNERIGGRQQRRDNENGCKQKRAPRRKWARHRDRSAEIEHTQTHCQTHTLLIIFITIYISIFTGIFILIKYNLFFCRMSLGGCVWSCCVSKHPGMDANDRTCLAQEQHVVQTGLQKSSTRSVEVKLTHILTRARTHTLTH